MPTVMSLVDALMYNVRVENKLKMAHMAIAAGGAQQVLQVTYPPVMMIDPGGGAIDVLLPTEATSDGLFFIVFNTADAAEVISVKEDSDTTVIATLAQNEACLLHCDGTTWRTLVGGIT